MGLTGCVGAGGERTQAPTPSPTPVFASDEAALAAAEVAYGAYLAGLDGALATLDHAGLEDVASGRALAEALDSVEGFREDEFRLTGQSSYDSASLIHAEDGYVEIYACWDISGTDIVDESGTPILIRDRPLRYPMQVSLEWVLSKSALVVSEAEVWDGENFCA
ncbi:hypothetical protein BH11ACT5_BH11ACT5_17260 [soil metagenome]